MPDTSPYHYTLDELRQLRLRTVITAAIVRDVIDDAEAARLRAEDRARALDGASGLIRKKENTIVQLENSLSLTNGQVETQGGTIRAFRSQLEGLSKHHATQAETITSLLKENERLQGRFVDGGVIRRKGRADVGVDELEHMEEELREIHKRAMFRGLAVDQFRRRLDSKTRMFHRLRERASLTSQRLRQANMEVAAAEDRIRRLEKHLGAEDRRAVIGIGSVLDFGKWDGFTLGHVVSADPGYVIWMLERHSTLRPSSAAVDMARDVIVGRKRREADSEHGKDLMQGAPADQIVMQAVPATGEGVALATEWKPATGQEDPGDQTNYYALGLARWGE